MVATLKSQQTNFVMIVIIAGIVAGVIFVKYAETVMTIVLAGLAEVVLITFEMMTANFATIVKDAGSAVVDAIAGGKRKNQQHRQARHHRQHKD